ncbi:MAG: shikimate dehydrogenase [bacterium]|nr:shikimate dehydrogenase [bacterium]
MATERQSPAGAKFLMGLIGSPIAASAAPAMHEAAAEALGARCHYQLIEIAGADQAALRSLLDGVRRLGFAGVNVTFPYKEAVLPLLDEISPRARDIGAINTVVVREGRLVGYNTDTSGFERAARDLVKSSGHGAVALIGAGGVGKAIAFALASLGVAELRIFDTDRAKAAQLARQLEGRLAARTGDRIEDAVDGVVGLINGTPIGMLPDCGMPVHESLLHSRMWVADAVYTPLWTPLLTAAKAKGAAVMSGRDLAVFQAADAFELFTGLKPQVSAIGDAFDGAMAQRYGAAR